MTEIGTCSIVYTDYYDGKHRHAQGDIPVEEAITLYLNGQALVKLMCTPTRVEELALGFLFNEGLIEKADEVAAVERCGDNRAVDVWLNHDIETPKLRTITSGCSGGTTFEKMSGEQSRVESDLRITMQHVTRLMKKLSHAAILYHRSGGVHATALATLEKEIQLLCVAEDIGRHNTLDKVAGTCLRQGWLMRDRVLLTTGRVSSEMVNKVTHMNVPIIISRTSPTSLSAQLARMWGITLIGYTRRHSFRAYTGEERVAPADNCAYVQQ